MADPQSTYYPGPDILGTLTIGSDHGRVQFSVLRWPDSPASHRVRLYCEAGAFTLSPACTESDLVALRDLLSAVIADAPAAQAIPVGETSEAGVEVAA